ncbi:hypothetical protein FDC66_06535 [Clostridium botulinum]|nr:hypothetical protein [Clostridium botulinum]
MKKSLCNVGSYFCTIISKFIIVFNIVISKGFICKMERIDLNIGKIYLSQWNQAMAIRELIANAIDETDDENIDIEKLSDKKWSIRNEGSEIKPEHFIIKEGEKSKKKGKIGKFGIGLKDAIGVLMSKGIRVTIITSEYEYIAEYQKKINLIKEECLFIKIAKSKSKWIGTQIILDNCCDNFINEAKSYFIRYREKITVINETKYGDVILEDDSNNNGTIYLNGIKIAYENTFLYSYNIKSEDNKLKNGISRERTELSREVYRDSLKQIIKYINNEKVLGEYYKSIIKSRDGSLKGELIYSEAQVGAIKYTFINNIKIVIFPSQRKGKLITLYRILNENNRVTAIVLLNSYYKKLMKEPELSDINVIADNYKEEYTKININSLGTEEMFCFNMICNFVKDNISSDIISKVILVEENIYSYSEEEREINIPIIELSYIKGCCLKIVNIVDDSTFKAKDVKEELLKKYIDIEITSYNQSSNCI